MNGKEKQIVVYLIQLCENFEWDLRRIHEENKAVGTIIRRN